MTQNKKKRIESLHRQGLSAGKIATNMGLSINTVKSHVRRHTEKTNLDNPGCCKQCGVAFLQPPRCRIKLFCSERCRIAWWNKNRGHLTRNGMITKVCALCGRHVYSYEKDNRKYCSHSCYINARFGGKKSNDKRTV